MDVQKRNAVKNEKNKNKRKSDFFRTPKNFGLRSASACVGRSVDYKRDRDGIELASQLNRSCIWESEI